MSSETQFISETVASHGSLFIDSVAYSMNRYTLDIPWSSLTTQHIQASKFKSIMGIQLYCWNLGSSDPVENVSFTSSYFSPTLLLPGSDFLPSHQFAQTWESNILMHPEASPLEAKHAVPRHPSYRADTPPFPEPSPQYMSSKRHVHNPPH